MSNSSLVNYVKISPNSNNPRNNKIMKITPHHSAGNFTVEQLGNGFSKPERGASANYGIGTDGRVGMYVEEKNRAWTSSSRDNDHQAITIEVANDGGAPDWHVNDKALAKLIDLCVDICKRNGIPKLVYDGTPNGNLTRHNMFANTNCPGPYLQGKFPYIADEVNRQLSGDSDNTGTNPGNINVGDKVKITGDTYTNGVKIPDSVKKSTYTVQQVKDDRVLLQEIVSWVYIKDVEVVGAPKKIEVGSRVKITGNTYTNGVKIPESVKKGTYTVQQLKSDRTLLKEIVSWVYLKDLQLVGSGTVSVAPTSKKAPKPKKIKVGGKVKITGSKYTNGVEIPNSVKGKTYTVQQLKPDKALLKEIVSWVYLKDLQII